MLFVKKKPFLLCAALIPTVVILLYLNSLSNAFIWDDIYFIVENPFITDCANLWKTINPLNLIKILPVSLSARPVTLSTIIMDICSGGLNPANMRFTNVLLHGFNSVLLFLFLNIILKNLKTSLIAALIFAFHPLATEPVNIVTFRSHLLAVFFVLISLISERLHYRKHNCLWITIALISFFLAVLSNEMAITLPLIWIFSHYILPEKKRFSKSGFIKISISFILISGFYLWFRTPRTNYSIKNSTNIVNQSNFDFLYPKFIFPKNLNQSTPKPETTDWNDVYKTPLINLLTMLNISKDYAINLAFPVSLSGDYNPKIAKNIKDAIPAIIFVLTYIIVFFHFLKVNKKIALALAWMGAWLLPALNIIPIMNIKADRYLYGALCGYGMLVGIISVNLSDKIFKTKYKKAVFIAAGLYIAILGFLTFKRNAVYTNNLTFFNSIIKKDDTISRAHLNLAAIKFKEGDFTSAEKYLNNAMILIQNNDHLKIKLAFLYLFQEKTNLSNNLTEELLQKRPDYQEALFAKGITLWQKGDTKKAIRILTELKNKKPHFIEPQIALKALIALQNESGLNIDKMAKNFEPRLFYGSIDFLSGIKLNPSLSPILNELKKIKSIRQNNKIL